MSRVQGLRSRVFCPDVLESDRKLLQSVTGTSFKIRQLLQSVTNIAKCGRILSQSVTIIAKCGNYYKMISKTTAVL